MYVQQTESNKRVVSLLQHADILLTGAVGLCMLSFGILSRHEPPHWQMQMLVAWRKIGKSKGFISIKVIRFL